jgi:uncharacterized membrane protein
MAKSADSTADPAATRRAVAAAKNDAIQPEILEHAAEILRPLLKDRTLAPQAALQMVAVMESHSGPLPHPSTLDGYEKILPGSALEILAMARAEQKHRHSINIYEALYPFVGSVLGFLALCLCFGSALYLGLLGHTDIAVAFLGVPVLAAVGWLVNARLPNRKPEPGSTPAPTTHDKRRG